jgi:nicotinate-nucleotide adenylyltransferase
MATARSAPEASDIRIPATPPGISIGLFGGSFDPPHPGHLMVSGLALRRLRLDRVWWLVSPGNPLKTVSPHSTLAARIAACRKLARDPRITVTGLEAGLDHRYSVETIAHLVARAPNTRFVWLMGADNLGNFHKWRGWREIAALVPIAIIDRPGESFDAVAAPAARALSRFRLPEAAAERLAFEPPPAWVFLHGPRNPLSSTEIRRKSRISAPS